jgi:hypothetical protein
VEACEIVQDPSDLTEATFFRIADLDRDRRLDLVTANGFFHGLVGEGSLSLYYQGVPQAGQGCAFPALPERLSTGGRPVEVTVADLNADGRPDLISTPDRNLGIHLQTPAGGFLDAPDLLLPTSELDVEANLVAAADWNGDGRLDLASFFVVRDIPVQGTGLHFQPDTGFTDGALPDVDLPEDPRAISANEIIAADVDGDGRQDVVVAADVSGTMAVFLQGASGRFSGADIVLGNGEVRKSAAGLAADLDGDGWMDLAQSGFDTFNVALYSQVSPGTFGAMPDQELGTALTVRMGAVAAGDLDGDGRQDLVVPSPGTAGLRISELAIFLQQSTGGFFPVPDAQIGTPTTTREPQSVVAADLDGDGRLDLACTSSDGSGNGDLAVFLQSPGGAGAFEDEPSEVLAVSALPPGSLLAADLDADGQLDLACANPESDLLTVFRQVGTGSFSAEPLELGGISAPVAVVAADLNADGRVDLASANGSSNDLAVFFQPPGGFVPSVVPGSPVILGGATSTPSPSSIAAEDLDGDGRLDLVAGTASSDAKVALFLQPRTGFAATAAADSVLVLPEPCNGVVLRDLNLDGLVDLAAATGRDDDASAGAVLAFFRRSSGFAAQADLVLGSSPGVSSYSSLVASDLNNDGELDLAAPSWRIVGASGGLPLGDRIALFFGGK